MDKILKTPIRNFSFHSILKSQKRFKISNGVKILIISIAIFGAGFLLVLPTGATVSSLVVEYWSESENNWLPLSGPIFSETNFLPGDGVTQLIRVTNNSLEIQRIATEAINENDPNNFASQLNLTIKEGATIIFNNTLAQFFSQGETYLSSLAGEGATTQYDFIIAFNSGSGDDYQGKTLGFDILVGFEGTEGGLPLPSPGGGGGGGLPPGLTILGESVTVTTTTETSVIIIWTTSYFSTSQVIYGAAGEAHTLNLSDNTGTPPKYGYEHTTPEYDTSPKVTAHSVTITGLTSGTTYYYRAVSHASLAISREFTFTTLGIKKIGEIEEEIPSEEEIGLAPTGEEEAPKESPEGEQVPYGAGKLPTGQVEKPSEEVTEAEEKEIVGLEEEKSLGGGLAPLLLASLGVIGETPWMVIIATFCLIGLVLIGIREWELVQKKKKKLS